MPRILLAVLFSAAFISAFISPAQAHIELIEPTPRYTIAESGDNKACPCGLGDSNRLCDVPSDRSDPDRSTDRVTTLAAGSIVTFQFDEYIGHAGRYRVAIDYDGADLDDFNANILLDVPDPAGNQGNAGGSLWELDVQLPNTPCDNCTLQLIQMMDGNTTDPVPDPVGRSSYYTCADVILVDGNGGGADAGVGGDGGTGPGGDAGPDGGDPGGCQASGPVSGPTGGSTWLAIGVLAFLCWRRRRYA